MINLGFAVCGSFCTHKNVISVLKELSDQYNITPIFSESVYNTDTRFGKASDFISEVENICNCKCIHSIKGAEPIGPKALFDVMIIAPCTGNTLGKLANGITDSSVTMAAKAHLRCNRPLVIALASNDALSANLKNISQMLNRKCVYFVPLSQDDPVNKPYSLVADFSLLLPTLAAAVAGKQYQKIFV